MLTRWKLSHTSKNSFSPSLLNRRLIAQKKEVSPALRPHILRDRLREQKYAHKIHRVTKPLSEYHQKQEQPQPVSNPEFEALNLMGPVLRSLVKCNYSSPTPIQQKVIPLAIRGHNIVGSAETGTGKTAAYALPLLHRLHIKLQRERAKIRQGLETPRVNAPLAIIVCPSRELAEQVMEATVNYASELPEVRIMGIYGALRTKSTQARELAKGVDILVSTPGRLITLIKSVNPQSEGAILDVSRVSMVVLDEVDRMLDMGHMPDIKTLFQYVPKQIENEDLQVLMFTATLMPKVMSQISRFAPNNQKIDLNWDMQTPATVKAVRYAVFPRRKHSLLAYLARRRGSIKGKKILVFARSCQRVINLHGLLKQDNFKVLCIHRKQSLSERQANIDGFRNNEAQILVSTELMARGMDVPDLEVVVNYDVPHAPEEYIHRIGRVGRNGKPGMAITLVSKLVQSVMLGNRPTQIDEKLYISKIEDLLGKKIHESVVPGPWLDKPKSSSPKETENEIPDEEKPIDPVNHAVQQATHKLLEKSERIANQAMKRKNIKNATMQEKEALHVTHQNSAKLRLRDFSEGRYEDVIQRMEIKRLKKKGTAVPQDYPEKLTELQQKKLKERDLKRKGLSARPSKPINGKLRYIRRMEAGISKKKLSDLNKNTSSKE